MVFVVVCAFTSQIAVPFWVGAIIDDYAFTAEIAGTIAGIEFTTVAVTSYLIAARIHTFSPRAICALGLIILTVCNAWSTMIADATSLSICRGIAGVGKGLTISAAFGLAGRSVSPARAFAFLNGGYALMSAATYYVIPYVINSHGAFGAFALLSAATLVGACFLPWMPGGRSVAEVGASQSGDQSTSVVGGVLTLLSLVLFIGASAAIGSYVERLGLRTGLPLTDVGMVLSIAALVTLIGPALAVAFDKRYGYKVPVFIAVIAKAVLALLLGMSASAAVFIVSVPLYNIAMLFAATYLQALMSLADKKGRFAAAAGASMTLGAGLGTFVGGVTITRFGLEHIGTTAVVMLLLVLVLVYLATSRLSSAPGPKVTGVVH